MILIAVGSTGDVGYRPERYWVRDEQLAGWEVDDDDGRPRHAKGPCPSCGHTTESEIVIVTVAVGVTGERDGTDPRQRITRVFDCVCRDNHRDSADPPVNHSSCGRWWLASIRIAPGDGQRVRAAVDDTLLEAAHALHAQTETEEARLRSSAEKWIAAITALFGLLGLSGVVVGKDAFTWLPTLTRVAVGVLALAAVVLAAGAIFYAYKAAYGWPKLVDLSDDQKLRDWYDDKRKRLGTAAGEHRLGIVLALAALGALGVAAGVIWFVPRTPARPLITVTLTTDTQLCGQLLDSVGNAVVRIRRTNGEVVTAQADQITSVKAATNCPA